MNICHLLRVVLTLLLGVFTSQALAVRYAVTDVGPNTYGTDLNDAGQVVGWRGGYLPQDYGNRAFVWSAGGGLEELVVPLSDTDFGSVAIAINASGQVVGHRYDNLAGSHVFLQKTPGSGIQELDGLTSWSLSPPNGVFHPVGLATDIDRTGRVVGSVWWRDWCGEQACVSAAVEWRPGQAVRELILPADPGLPGYSPYMSGAAGISDSDSGQIVVNASYRDFTLRDEFHDRLFIVNPDGRPTRLSVTGVATAINENGWLTGYTRDVDSGLGLARAFVWKPDIGQINLHTPEWTESVARAINASGQVVGFFTVPPVGEQFAFVWSTEGGLTDLNKLFNKLLETNTEDWVLGSAEAINSAGQILVNGVIVGESTAHALLLTPVKATSTTALSASTATPRYGDSIVLTATVTGDNPTGTVTFKEGAATLGTGTLSNRTATFPTSSLAVGPHSLTATYGGDTNNAGSTSNAVSITVMPAGTGDQEPLTLIVDPTIIPVGGSSALSTVGGSGTGAVSYEVALTLQMVGSSAASCSVSGSTLTATSIGTCSVRAIKAGDDNYNAQTSNSVEITVTTADGKFPTTTRLNAAPTAPQIGDPVVFTATVRGNDPTGTVTFKDGGTELGTETLSAGTATFTTSSLAVGTHSITAEYAGDASHNGSISMGLLVTVTAPGACMIPPAGLIAWWPFDELSGDSAADPVGGHSAAYVNNPVPTPGQVSAALGFDGTNYAEAPDSDAWDFGNRDFTIELWANFETEGGGSLGYPSHIFVGHDEGGGNIPNKWFFALGGGQLQFDFAGGGPQRFLALGPFTPTIGQWYHLAVVRNGNEWLGFVNGQAVGPAVIDASVISDANAPLTIGQAEQLGFVNGRLDELSIYNRALAPSELAAIVATGGEGKCKTTADNYQLTVNVSGSGTVTSSPAGIDCGAACTTSFAAGTPITLTATPTGAATFSGWSPASCGSPFALTSNTVCSATFTAKSPTQTTIDVSPNPAPFGQTVTFIATVTGGSSTPTGTATIKDGTTTLGTATLASGQATFTTTSLTVGNHSIAADYTGDATHASSISSLVNLTVTKADQAPLTVIANPSSITSGGTSTLSTTGGSGTGAVSYAAIGSGGVTCSISGATLTATGSGSCAVTATKAADENYNAATSAALLITVTPIAKVNSMTALVSDINPSTYGQLVTFTATVSGPGSAPPTGTVTFRVGTTVLGTSAVSGSVATFKTASLAIGQRSIRAAYSGDNLYNPSTSPIYQQVVTQAESGISLSSSSNPSAYSQSVTLTATVTGANPTGRVTFKDGATVLGTRTLSGGVATLRISSLTAGTHEITASYAGNARNTPSSATLNQIVDPAATTTSLTSSRNPSRVGRSVTFNAVVNYTGVSGTVTFKDGGIELATVPMSGRRATFATSSLGVGEHPITATYNGNGNTLSSTSGTVNQVVQ